jgi:hypothetical protein
MSKRNASERTDERGCPDTGEQDQGSSVRACQRRPSSEPTQPPSSSPTGPCGELADFVARTDRVERKVRIAKVILEQLPPDDAQARLLRVAVVRRDELLLDAVLTTLRARDLSRQ